MSTFVTQSKNVSSYADQGKNTSVFSTILRHGKDMTIQALADVKFTDVVFADGRVLQDLTFAELGDQIWTLQNKN